MADYQSEQEAKASYVSAYSFDQHLAGFSHLTGFNHQATEKDFENNFTFDCNEVEDNSTICLKPVERWVYFSYY